MLTRLTKYWVYRTGLILALLPMAVFAQVLQEVAPVHPWPAPLYWQASEAEVHAERYGSAHTAAAGFAPQATSPVNSLVFVAITPCRIVDTRTGQGFSGSFGPPALVGGASRTFPIQSSPDCTVPSIAQAYSFNVTVVPPGFLGFITAYPTGAARPNASTLNDSTGLIISNAAIVPAGTSGSVDVFANNPTDLIIDINGYYAPQTGITLAQGTVAAPSLSFSGDPGTGIFSSAANTLNFATNGTSRLTVRSDGDVDIPGNVRKSTNLLLHTLGTFNTALGINALNPASTGTQNVALGQSALFDNTSGGSNTAVGRSALQTNATGNNNTGVGTSALLSNSAGSDNTTVGYNSQLAAKGSDNTSVGSNALGFSGFQWTGSSNTALGQRALSALSSGDDNIAVGQQAGSLLTGGSHNIYIGNPGSANDSQTLAIGSNLQNRAFIGGVFNVNNGTSTAVLINNAGQLGTISSSRRYKQDIQDMGEMSSGLMKLRPVAFHYKEFPNNPLEYGLIAEEVNEVYPELVLRGKDGQIETVQYHKVNALLLNEVQKLNRDLKQQSNEREQHDRQQSETIHSLEARLAAMEALLSGKVATSATPGQ